MISTTTWHPIETMPEGRQVLVAEGSMVRLGRREGDVIHAPFPITLRLWSYWAELPAPPKVKRA